MLADKGSHVVSCCLLRDLGPSLNRGRSGGGAERGFGVFSNFRI